MRSGHCCEGWAQRGADFCKAFADSESEPGLFIEEPGQKQAMTLFGSR